jgi:ComF family protein
MLRAITDSLISLVYPQECRVCSALVERNSTGVACETCWSSTKIFNGDEMLCEKCGAFFSDKKAPVAVYCHKCDDHSYDRAFAIGVYERALSASILFLKSTPKVPKHLDRLIRDRTEGLDADLIVPAPLSKMRFLERGFNQSELIADIVGKAAGLPVDHFSLQRKKHTPIHRIGMDQRARELTVEKAFEVSRPNLVRGKRILFVDDVLTSGSTASACAKALKKSGATSVDVFTVARAVMS